MMPPAVAAAVVLVLMPHANIILEKMISISLFE